MAQVDKYANADLEKGKLGAAANVAGNKVVTSIVNLEIAADDATKSVYRVFPDMNPCLIPVDIKIVNDAIGTLKADLGLYEGEKGNAINDKVFATGLDLTAAHTTGTALNGLIAVAAKDVGKQLFELAGHTIADRKDTYDIALTATAAAGATGTVTVIGTFVQG